MSYFPPSSHQQPTQSEADSLHYGSIFCHTFSRIAIFNGDICDLVLGIGYWVYRFNKHFAKISIHISIPISQWNKIEDDEYIYVQNPIPLTHIHIGLPTSHWYIVEDNAMCISQNPIPKIPIHIGVPSW